MPKLPKLGRELGFQSGPHIIFGTYEGYHVTMYHKLGLLNSFLNPAANFKKMFVAVELLTDEQTSKLIEFVNNNKKDLIISQGNVQDSILFMIINEDIRAYNVKRYNQTMSKLVEYFKAEGIKPEYRCAFCGKEEVDHISIINDVAFPSHIACEK